MEFGVFIHPADSIYDHSLVIRPMSDTIGLCPPLIMNVAEITELLGLFAHAPCQVEDRLGPRSAAPPFPRSRH